MTVFSSEVAWRQCFCRKRAGVSPLLGTTLRRFWLCFLKLFRIYMGYECFDLLQLQGHTVPYFRCQVCVLLETTLNSLAILMLNLAERFPIFMKHPQKSTFCFLTSIHQVTEQWKQHWKDLKVFTLFYSAFQYNFHKYSMV